MAKCYYCNSDAGYLPFRCNFCGMIFCKTHRMPEHHNCSFDLIQKSKDNVVKFYVSYQDALEFMGNGEITVDKIYDYVTSKKLSKHEATELLEQIIEESDDNEIREVSILAFKALEIKSNEVFDILENCLLSDDNPLVRNTAERIITELFPIKSKKPLEWLRKQEKRSENNNNY